MDIAPGEGTDNAVVVFFHSSMGYRIIDKYDLNRIICDSSGVDVIYTHFPGVSGFRLQLPSNFFGHPGPLFKWESY